MLTPNARGRGAPSLCASRIGAARQGGGSRTQASPEVASLGRDELGRPAGAGGKEVVVVVGEEGPPARAWQPMWERPGVPGVGPPCLTRFPSKLPGKMPGAGRLEGGLNGVGRSSAAAICHAVKAAAFSGRHGEGTANSKFISPGRML